MTKRKRLELLDSAFKPRDAVCVHFDVDAAECKRRASTRRGHETKELFGSSRGFKVIDSFKKQLEAPETKEGFKQVVVVRNDEDIDRLLFRLGVRRSIKSVFEEQKESVFEDDKVTDNRKDKVIENRNVNLYRAPMAASGSSMSVNVISKKLGLEMDDVLSLYVVGSRVWGSAVAESDWNMIVVTESGGHRSRRTVDDIEAHTFSKREWTVESRKCQFMCWLTLFLPPDAIWKQEHTLSDLRFNLKEFVVALKREMDRDCKKIKIFHGKQRMDKVQRTFAHCLRTMRITKQIIVLVQGMFPGQNEVDLTQHSWVGSIRFDEITKRAAKEMETVSAMSSDAISKWTDPLIIEYKECLDFLDI